MAGPTPRIIHRPSASRRAQKAGSQKNSSVMEPWHKDRSRARMPNWVVHSRSIARLAALQVAGSHYPNRWRLGGY